MSKSRCCLDLISGIQLALFSDQQMKGLWNFLRLSLRIRKISFPELFLSVEESWAQEQP